MTNLTILIFLIGHFNKQNHIKKAYLYPSMKE